MRVSLLFVACALVGALALAGASPMSRMMTQQTQQHHKEDLSLDASFASFLEMEASADAQFEAALEAQLGGSVEQALATDAETETEAETEADASSEITPAIHVRSAKTTGRRNGGVVLDGGNAIGPRGPDMSKSAADGSVLAPYDPLRISLWHEKRLERRQAARQKIVNKENEIETCRQMKVRADARLAQEKIEIAEEKRQAALEAKEAAKKKANIEASYESELMEVATQVGAEAGAEASVEAESQSAAQASAAMLAELDAEAELDLATEAAQEMEAEADAVEAQADLASMERDIRAEMAEELSLAEVDAQVGAEVEAEVDAEVEAEAQAEAQVEAEMDAEADVDAEAEMEAQMDAEADAEAETEVDAEVDAEADAEAEEEDSYTAHSLAETEAEAEAESGDAPTHLVPTAHVMIGNRGEEMENLPNDEGRAVFARRERDQSITRFSKEMTSSAGRAVVTGVTKLPCGKEVTDQGLFAAVVNPNIRNAVEAVDPQAPRWVDDSIRTVFKLPVVPQIREAKVEDQYGDMPVDE